MHAPSKLPTQRLTASLLLILGGLCFCGTQAYATLLSAVTANSLDANDVYEISLGDLADGELTNIDRTHTHTNLPSALLGLDYVLTANDDKAAAPGFSLALTFEPNTRLYLCIDFRVGDNDGADGPVLGNGLMDWVITQGWENTGLSWSKANEVGTTAFMVYQLDVPGTGHTLFEQNDGNVRNMYQLAARRIPRGHINVRPGATLRVANRTSILGNGGDLTVTSGSSMTLTTGIVTDLGNAALAQGSSFSGTGTLGVNHRWINDSTFVRPDTPGSEMIINSPVSLEVNLAPGFGDTDGDGFSDRGEGSFDQDLDALPDFRDPDALAITRPPRDWLIENGLPTDGSADFSDDDFDTMDSLEEYHAGTHPLDPNSVLRLHLHPFDENEISLLEVETVALKNYRLWATTNSIPDAGFPLLLGGFSANGPITPLNLTKSPEDFRAYLRVEVLP